MPEKQPFRRRPWTFASYRCKPKIQVPKIDTYINEINDCHQQYIKLRLSQEDKHASSISPLPFIIPRAKTSSHIDTKSPYTVAFPLPSKSKKAWQDDLTKQNIPYETEQVMSDTNHVTDEFEKEPPPFDPIRLCDHLRHAGFGSPMLVTSSAQQEISRYHLPPGVKSRKLPRNPSKREKIKGRARLDYEMANLKAIAFCEQQTPKMFRTASAHMRNRDVQFVEDEMREHAQRGDEIDDTGSIVMGVSRDELFTRIEAWIEEVANCSEKIP